MKFRAIAGYCLAAFVCCYAQLSRAAIPPAPENLQPAWLFGEIMLTWNEVPEAAGYNVYRYDNANAVWVQTAANLSEPRYREMNVWAPTTYSVTAVNADGESAPAGPVVAEQTGEGFVISLNQWLWSIYDTQAVIKWTVDLVAGADGMLEVGTSYTNLTFFAWDTNYTGLHQFTVTNLSPGTYYICRITSVASNRTGVTGWTSFTTLPTNNPPITQDQTYDIYEDQLPPLQLFLNAWDPDFQWPLTINILNGPSHGILAQSNYWSGYFYLPATNWFGTDTITFVASDGLATSAPGTITINVMPSNDPPAPISQTVTTIEDTPITIPMRANDVEGDPLTSVWIAVWPTNGWVWADGTNVIYTPYQNFSGDDSFAFNVCDAGGACSWQPGIVVIHITAGNDAPQASDVYVNAHAEATLHASFAVSDFEGDTLACEVVSGPSSGTVTVSGTNFTYTPNSGLSYFIDNFTYRVLDAQTNSNVARVWVSVGNTNTVPEAHDQTIIATQNKSTYFVLDVSDPDPDFLQVLVQAGPTNGIIEFFSTGITYRPATNYLGPDSFSYRIFDGTATGNVATVTIEVIPNRPPIADPLSFSVPEEWTADFTLTGSDPDGDAITFVLLSQPAHGSLREIHFSWPLSDYPGHYQYTPVPNFNGTDSFTFTWNDGQTNGNIETVIITVTPVNDAPVVNAQSVTTVEDTAKNITLTASDVENDPLNFIIVNNPAHGTLTGAAPNLVYTPTTNYSGSDSFTFKAYDGSSNSAVKTVSITVTAVNDPPFAFDQTVTINEDTPIDVTLTSFDPDGPNASYILFSQPTHGTLTLMNAQGTIRKYTPNANFHGTDSFSFIVSDGIVLGNIGTITINVTSVNDPPDAISKAYQIPEDTSLNVNLAGLVNDADGDTLTYTIVTPPGAGTLSGTLPNLVYRPNTNVWGYDHFYFKVSDGIAETSTREIWIEITSVNDAPMALNTSFTVAEDGVLTLSPSSTDVDYYPATYRVVTLPAHGTLTISGSSSNNWTYRPFTNFNGTDSVVFIANDLMADSNPGTVTITVTPVNDRPVANNQSLTIAEDTTTSITLTGSDVDGEGLTFVLVTAPMHGSVLALGPGIYGYTPDANYNGPDSFSFVARDSVTSSAPATVSITITPVNDGPVANGQTVTTTEDTPLNVTLTGSDVDGNALSYSIVSGPTIGTLTGTAPHLTYTPNPNFNGTDTFTFKVHDGTTYSGVATVTIVVTSLNDAPIASPAAVATAEDTGIAVTLTASDIDGDALSYSIVSAPTHGTLSGAAPNVVYTPDTNYNGSDSFTFSATDPANNSSTATVTITVNPVNDAPVASAQSITTAEETAVSLTLTGLDVEGDTLSFVVVSNPAHGTLSGSVPNLVYTPAADYNGPDSFTFKVNDGTVDGNTATVSITVTSVNDPPVADAQSITTAEDTAANITLTGSDVDGDALSFVVVSNPTHGTLSGSIPNLVYTPAANYNGPDSFTFKVTDGTVDGNTATVSVTVTSVNDVPVANAQSIITAEDTAANITLTGSDADADALSYSVVNGPAHGTLTGNGATLVYTPAANYNGPDSFMFKVSDAANNSSTATVTITVTPGNDAPIANAQSIATAEDTAANITLTGSDVDGGALSFSVVSGPSHGTLSGSAPNLVYTPAPNYNGPDSFTFRANDGTVDGNVATVSVTVTAMNDAPVANGQSVSTAYNTSVNITLTGSDTEGSALTYTVVSNPANGTLSGTGANRTFTPNIGWSGTTSFTFKVNDGALDSAVATVTITVAAPTSTPAAPSGLTATAVSKTQINLTWNDESANEDGFKIERSTNGTSWTQIATVGPNVGNYSSTGLSANKTYYYRVRAYNVLGNSGYSNTASAKTLH